MYRKMCKGCDTQFVALRSDTLTCSPKCRQRYKRMCDAITAEMAKTHDRCRECDMPKEKWRTVCVACRDRLSGGGSIAVQDRNSVCPAVAKVGELSDDQADDGRCTRCGISADVIDGICIVCCNALDAGEDDDA